MRQRLFIASVISGLILPLSGCYTAGYYTGKAVHMVIPQGPPSQQVYVETPPRESPPPVYVPESIVIPPSTPEAGAEIEAPAPSSSDDGAAAPSAPDDSGGY